MGTNRTPLSIMAAILGSENTHNMDAASTDDEVLVGKMIEDSLRECKDRGNPRMKAEECVGVMPVMVSNEGNEVRTSEHVGPRLFEA
jgi:hypothetical protein